LNNHRSQLLTDLDELLNLLKLSVARQSFYLKKGKFGHYKLEAMKYNSLYISAKELVRLYDQSFILQREVLFKNYPHGLQLK